MRLFHSLVFDETVESTTTTQYTNPIWIDEYGLADSIKIVGHITRCNGTSPTLTVRLRESADPGDNRFWVNKNATAEINAATLSTTTLTVVRGHDAGGTPFSGFVQAAISATGTSARFHLRLWLTGRGEQRPGRRNGGAGGNGAARSGM